MSSQEGTPKITRELQIEQEASRLDCELRGALAEIDQIICVLTEELEASEGQSDSFDAEQRTVLKGYKAAREELLKATAIFNVSDVGSRQS